MPGSPHAGASVAPTHVLPAVQEDAPPPESPTSERDIPLPWSRSMGAAELEELVGHPVDWAAVQAQAVAAQQGGVDSVLQAWWELRVLHVIALIATLPAAYAGYDASA